MYKRWGKRCLDLILAGAGLIILFPLFACIFLLIYLIDRSNPLFLQSRPGLNGYTFKIVKFRTMTDISSVEGDLEDKKRITRLGKILRQTSLDEIPQLWNVMKGEMSIVGPRPLLVEYLELYSREQKLRHTVKPGITGWSQINGRNAITWEQKLDMDVWYAKNVSFVLDLRIILITALKLLKRPFGDLRETEIPEKFKG